ncbi:Calx-beta domain-containing protein [Longispora sp. NPDC051575]|uniref:Calx-beta domain-containing protein n=1 Tax=Longispora sp. NPDC051575 TaxID=3154943 RepID=UPI0034264F0C
MRNVSRLFVAAAAVAMATLGMVPAAQAASPNNTFSVNGGFASEYERSCQAVAPFACSFSATSMPVTVSISSPRSYPVTVGYALESMTATNGVDYTATTGTVTIPAGAFWGRVQIPIVNDGIAEVTEEFRVRLTSSSVGGNFSATGVARIFDGGQVPYDCTLSKSDLATTTISCANRPVDQPWKVVVNCQDIGMGYIQASGPVITGNGTSTAVCSPAAYVSVYFADLTPVPPIFP